MRTSWKMRVAKVNASAARRNRRPCSKGARQSAQPARRPAGAPGRRRGRRTAQRRGQRAAVTAPRSIAPAASNTRPLAIASSSSSSPSPAPRRAAASASAAARPPQSVSASASASASNALVVARLTDLTQRRRGLPIERGRPSQLTLASLRSPRQRRRRPRPRSWLRVAPFVARAPQRPASRAQLSNLDEEIGGVEERRAQLGRGPHPPQLADRARWQPAPRRTHRHRPAARPGSARPRPACARRRSRPERSNARR